MIKQIYRFYLKGLKRRWMNRTLKTFKTVGSNVRLRYKSNFIKPECLAIGNNVHIGENAWWRCDGGVVIGDNTIISRNCVIFTANHNYEGVSLPYDKTFKKKSVEIGSQVWIGMNVMIVQGVTIGDGAIIAMGTVITKDVPPLAIVGGERSRILKYRDREHYDELLNNKQFYVINHED